ncbi:hypothetical protein [Streptomyces sp. NPDC006551]|uniref:hypothetical protein n=1 Tax=Streptomyces sp. NPDC006551 TaxID=3157178 RepID=UPI0033A19875
MARLRVDVDELVVRLSWWEKAVARRGTIRIPLSAVAGVTLQEDWWRALRGVRERGLTIPEVVCVGVWRHAEGSDFLSVRPRHGPVVLVGLRAAAPFVQVAVTAEDADRVVSFVRAAIAQDPTVRRQEGTHALGAGAVRARELP